MVKLKVKTKSTSWNFNIKECPKGEHIIVERTFGRGRPKKVKIFNPYYIWAAGADGVVTKSYIVEDGSRFACFTKKSPPIAWQPFTKPKHPDQG